MTNNSDPLKQILKSQDNAPKSFNPLLVVIVVACFAVLMVFLSTEILKFYGFALFIGLPFVIGLFCSLLVCMQSKQSLGTCFIMSILGLFMSSAILIMIAMEGMVCIVLVLPLSLLLTLSGAAFGYLIQEFIWDSYKKKSLIILIIFIFPLSLSVEASLDLKPNLIEVRSTIIINASKEIVWDEVVSSELPPPDELIFKTGIAYPVRAEIDGEGVGAVRYCVFSTGKFVEPIEVWDEPNSLQFSVTHSPPPMKELSIYSDIHPPHLDGFLQSKKGQFKLIGLANNKTLLEGTTWYENKMWPESYWKLWSDYIIHKIHIRVLKHIKTSSESLQNDKLLEF